MNIFCLPFFLTTLVFLGEVHALKKLECYICNSDYKSTCLNTALSTVTCYGDDHICVTAVFWSKSKKQHDLSKRCGNKNEFKCKDNEICWICNKSFCDNEFNTYFSKVFEKTKESKGLGYIIDNTVSEPAPNQTKTETKTKNETKLKTPAKDSDTTDVSSKENKDSGKNVSNVVVVEVPAKSEIVTEEEVTEEEVSPHPLTVELNLEFTILGNKTINVNVNKEGTQIQGNETFSTGGVSFEGPFVDMNNQNPNKLQLNFNVDENGNIVGNRSVKIVK